MVVSRALCPHPDPGLPSGRMERLLLRVDPLTSLGRWTLVFGLQKERNIQERLPCWLKALEHMLQRLSHCDVQQSPLAMGEGGLIALGCVWALYFCKASGWL